MKNCRLCIVMLLCLCLCASLFSVSASAASSAEEPSEDGGVALSPVEQVFQVIALLILFGGIAMLPVYYVLNKRRRRIIASFEDQKEPQEDETNEET